MKAVQMSRKPQLCSGGDPQSHSFHSSTTRTRSSTTTETIALQTSENYNRTFKHVKNACMELCCNSSMQLTIRF